MYWLGPILVVLLIVGASIFTVMKMQPVSRGFGEETRRAELEASGAFVDLGPAQLLETYLDAIGGRGVLSEMKSARFEGRQRTPEGSRDFKMLVRDQDRGMLAFEPESGLEENYFLNDAYAWKVLISPDGSRGFERLGEEGTRELMLTLQLHDPLRELALGARGEIWSVRGVIFRGAPCYKISVEGPDGSFVECYLDEQTLYLLATERVYAADGKQVIRRVVFGDYRMTSGIVEPFRFTIYHDDEFVSETELNSIHINADVKPSLFEIPPEIR
jgi:hypothetical protein